MKVGELIEMLQQFPDDCLVVVDGYESGFDTPHPPRTITVFKRERDGSWDGEFEEEEFYRDETSGEDISAVYLARRSW